MSSVPPLGYGFITEGLALPPLEQVLRAVRVVDIPMRVTFRSVNRRQSALIQGPAGWGEFAPFLEYDDHEAAAWLACALESAWLGGAARSTNHYSGERNPSRGERRAGSRSAEQLSWNHPRA